MASIAQAPVLPETDRMTFDVMSLWRALTSTPKCADALARTATRLGLDRQPPVMRHHLVQFRLYGEELRLDSVYVSALSSGYFRTTLFPIPLRQIGVKISVERLEEAAIREVYIAAVSRADIEAIFVNTENVVFDENLIGFGVEAGESPRLVETYAWEDRNVEVSESVELRTNLLTGVVTPYYRHVLGAGDTLTDRGVLTSDEYHALKTIVDEIETACDLARLDPVFIYSKKEDESGTPHVAFYLTSQAYHEGEPMPCRSKRY